MNIPSLPRTAFSLVLILAALLPGCAPAAERPDGFRNLRYSSGVRPLPPAELLAGTIAERWQGSAAADFVGRVVDMEGKTIGGASVQSANNVTVSDEHGWFSLPAEGLPQWIRVTHPDFISRTRAAAPGIPVLFRLSPDDGKTLVLHFGGDTMFGRRFFDPNEDDYTADGLLPLKPTIDDHLRLLAPIRPLMENADLTILNLETTLSDQAYFRRNDPRPIEFHPTANHVYASSPTSVTALRQSGVDIVALANNHSYDMLEAGLNFSLSALDQAGMLHFGAGMNESGAWAPAVISSKGQTIAFIGCTTIRIPLSTPAVNDVPFVASDLLKKGGAAYCTEARLRSAVMAAKQQADVVIVMLHGGREYDRAPTTRMSYLTEIARQAGASLVINHHPHVVGGLSWRDRSLVAWTIGNFLSDQTIWPTFESYMLAVYLRDGEISRVYAEPLIIDGFLPHGLTGELADYVVRGAAGREPGPFIMESGAMEMDLDGRAVQRTYTLAVEAPMETGQIIAVPPAQWISGFRGTGRLRLGRDLLWVGGFENREVDSVSYVAPLWDLNLGSPRVGKDYAYEGETGIRLVRAANNTSDAVTSNIHRILIKPLSSLSITGMMRISEGGQAQVQLSWYPATAGPSSSKTIYPIEVQSAGTWQSFRFDAQAPGDAVALGVYLRLLPPAQGTTSVDFDNIRLIEWADTTAPYSPLFNYALLTGSGVITFSQRVLPGAEQWFAIPAGTSTP